MYITHTGPDITIEEFYRGKNVFITGATGFLGKVLIDKLLRACPDIGNIYILIRPKKGLTIQERIDKLLDDLLFDTLKKNNPSQISKLIPILGDCAELKLGISPSDYNLLTSNVNVIYHVAASVRFDDALKSAILLNTRGTRELCNLALQTKNLAVLVHISTTFSNCVVGREIKEELYPAPDDWRKVIEIAENFDGQILPILGDKYLGSYPNTYTFTKALAEHVVNDLCTNCIPAVICRPSIVVSSLDDPVEGWIDNFNGPVGLLVACGKGLVRCCYQDVTVYPDYIPVDCVIKAFIVASWHISLKKNISSIEVVNICSGRGWISNGDLVQVCRSFSHEIPLNDLIWVPKGNPTKCKYYAYICIVLFQLIPAMFLDLGIKLAGKKPIITRLQTKIFGATLQLRYFTNQEWIFRNDKFVKLEKQILEKDRNIWSFDYNNADVVKFLRNCMVGSRTYLFKESDDTLPHAKKHYWRMYWVDKFAMILLYGFFIWLLYSYKVHEVIINYLYNLFWYYFDGADI